jgi:uncharacterized protein (DUF2132 family)
MSHPLLHWVKLETIVTDLVEYLWREKLWQLIRINCFRANPSIKSSLVFLRKTERARKEVEELYIEWVLDGYLTDKSIPEKRPDMIG